MLEASQRHVESLRHRAHPSSLLLNGNYVSGHEHVLATLDVVHHLVKQLSGVPYV
jgi:hypothetical protein